MTYPRNHAVAACLSACLAAQGTIEGVEPNDTPATATVLLPGAQAYGGLAVGVPGDRDLYRIDLAAPGDLRAFTAPGFAGQVGDTRLALCDALGNAVVEVDDGGVATHGYYSLLTVPALDAGTWLRLQQLQDCPEEPPGA